MNSRVGINVFGYASANIGLGVVVREFCRALIANGHPIAIVDMDAGGGRSGHDLSLQEHFRPADAAPHPVNLWMVGADQMLHIALKVCGETRFHDRLNVAFAWWELPDIPLHWAAAGEAFDALVTGSEFVCQAFANHVSGTPVLMARSPLHMPDGVAADRPRFALPQDSLIVYTGFEPASGPQRKNPLAAIFAFQKAFGLHEQVRLVIKVNNPGADPRSTAALRQLDELVAQDPRVTLVRERLSQRDLLCLYASCDIVMSLHRAEGLGLMPLEAMRLGKPVVATGWSGNMTYMNHCNAGLVSYALRDVDEQAQSYSPSVTGVHSRWAEPSVDHAAAWLRTLADDAGLRQAMGDRAARDSARYNDDALRTPFAEELAALNRLREQQPRKDLAAVRERILAAHQKYRWSRERGAAQLWEEVRKEARRVYGRHIGWRFERLQAR